jgi:hypothetical protein
MVPPAPQPVADPGQFQRGGAEVGAGGQGEPERHAAGGHGRLGVVVDQVGGEGVEAGQPGGDGEGEPHRGGVVVAADHHGGGRRRLARGPGGDERGRWQLAEERGGQQHRPGDGELPADGSAQGGEGAGIGGKGRDDPVAVDRGQGQQHRDQAGLDQQDPSEAGGQQPLRAADLLGGPGQAGEGDDGDGQRRQAGEAHDRGDLLGSVAAAQAGQQPDQAADPAADGDQVRPLHQQVGGPQARLSGGVPPGGVGAHRRRGRQADRGQRRPAPRPCQQDAHRGDGEQQRGRLADQRPPRAGGDQGTHRHADRRPLGQRFRREPAHRQDQPRAEQRGSGGREAAAEDQQAGGRRPQQQRQPPVEGPAAGQPQRRGRRGGRGRGRVGRWRRDPDAHAEREGAAGDMAVHPRDRPPAHRVGAVPELADGCLQLQGSAGHRGGPASPDRPAAWVQHLDAGQRRVGRLGEGEQHPPWWPLQRRAGGRVRAADHGVRAGARGGAGQPQRRQRQGQQRAPQDPEPSPHRTASGPIWHVAQAVSYIS